MYTWHALDIVTWSKCLYEHWCEMENGNYSAELTICYKVAPLSGNFHIKWAQKVLKLFLKSLVFTWPSTTKEFRPSTWRYLWNTSYVYITWQSVWKHSLVQMSLICLSVQRTVVEFKYYCCPESESFPLFPFILLKNDLQWSFSDCTYCTYECIICSVLENAMCSEFLSLLLMFSLCIYSMSQLFHTMLNMPQYLFNCWDRTGLSKGFCEDWCWWQWCGLCHKPCILWTRTAWLYTIQL